MDRPTAYGMTSSRAECTTYTGIAGLIVPIRCWATIVVNGSCVSSTDAGVPVLDRLDVVTKAWLARSVTHSPSTASIAWRPAALR